MQSEPAHILSVVILRVLVSGPQINYRRKTVRIQWSSLCQTSAMLIGEKDDVYWILRRF